MHKSKILLTLFLNFSYNKIRDIGTKKLFESLFQLSYLNFLSMNFKYNKIGDITNKDL